MGVPLTKTGAYEIDLSETLKLRMGLKFGFMNYQNPLTKYKLYPDGKYDLAFAEDIDLKLDRKSVV